MSGNRRAFLENTFAIAGAAALTGCKSTPPEPTAPMPEPEPAPAKPEETDTLLDGLDPENFILHNPKPLALESLRHSIGMGAITATSRLFVRNNLPHPDPQIISTAAQWTLQISGVQIPRRFTLSELKSFAYDNICAVLQCSGNGRAFFKHGPSGSQWATGAAGCVSWGGVKLSKVINACGGSKDNMKFITGTGGEPIPEGVERDKVVVERSIPIEKGMKDCLIAWELNGEPIPLSHGGPLRLVVPGYFGCNQIKYVQEIAATVEQSKAKIQQSGYRFRDIGQKGHPSQASMWRMPVKSWIVSSLKSADGNIRFNGVAFSGERGVQAVEYSLNGSDWTAATFYGPDLGIHAWRCFQFELNQVPDTIQTVFTRATDTAGDAQPKHRAENERGYGNNSWLDHGYALKDIQKNEKTEASVAAISPETQEAGRQLFAEGELPCGSCHSLSDAQAVAEIGPNLDMLKPDSARVERAVKNGVGAMPSYTELLTQEEIKTLAEYVSAVTRK
ncbi:MAG: molybdopterin-dependent oxidoreductase [Myxococcota bacterium]